MYSNKSLFFLKRMLEKCHLHCAAVDPYSPIEMGLDSRLAMFLENTGSTSTYYDYFPNVKPKTVYRISDIFLCRYLFFELPTVPAFYAAVISFTVLSAILLLSSIFVFSQHNLFFAYVFRINP